ncbi:hypothetical protein OAB94_02140 [Flavobacteriaceae bacterium]|nr:hypothetical protein [Flavobacteriaceae bacterium]
MKQNLYSTISAQGLITSVIYPDVDGFSERAYQSSMDKSQNLYSGAEKSQNLSIYKNELVYGLRNNQNCNNEFGFSTVNGLNKMSPARLPEDLYFIGVAGGEFHYGGNTVWGDAQSSEAMTVFKAGTHTVQNTGPSQIVAGDLVAFKAPPDGSGRLRPETVTFDPTVSTTDINLILNDIKTTNENGIGGIKGLKKDQIFDEKGNLIDIKRTPDQEQAAAFKFGLAGMFKAVLKLLDVNEDVIQSKMDLKNRENNDVEGYVKIDNIDEWIASKMLESDKNGNIKLLMNAVMKSYKLKTSAIIGKALNTAVPRTGSLDLMVGHTRLC